MISCSICFDSLTEIIYRFEQCSTHVFCFSCFTSKIQLENLKCCDCNLVLKLPALKPAKNSCFYCDTQAVLLTCENSHNLCIDCIQDRETKVECYYCYIRIFTYCSSCRTLLTLKTPIPVHPCHSKCSECFRMKKQNSDCFLCFEENSSEKYICRLCHKRSIVRASCVIHGLCIECIMILQTFKTDIYRKILNCNNCINIFKSIDNTKICSLCGNEENNLIPIMLCMKKHQCCLKCLRGEIIMKNISCRDCRVYFQLKLKRKINCCIICYYESKYIYKSTCSKHYICEFCFKRVASLSIKIYTKMIHCEDCKNSIKSNYSNSSIRKSDNQHCFLCIKESVIDNGCKSHKFCKKCLKFNMIDIIKIVGNCTYCNDFNSKGCRICFKLIDKPCSLKCSYEHIYCLTCIMQITNFLKIDNEICSECKDIVFNQSYMKNKRCIQCRILMKPSSNCTEHSICNDCLLNITDNFNQALKNCKQCRKLVENQGFGDISTNANKSSYINISSTRPLNVKKTSVNAEMGTKESSYEELDRAFVGNSLRSQSSQKVKKYDFNKRNKMSIDGKKTELCFSPQKPKISQITNIKINPDDFKNKAALNFKLSPDSQYTEKPKKVGLKEMGPFLKEKPVPSKNVFINDQKEIYIKNNSNTNLRDLMINQEDKPLCILCNIQCDQLLCKHANCSKCFTNQFNSNFSSFILALNTKNILALNVLSFQVVCNISGCNAKYNVLLDTYWNNAYSIISPFFNGDQQVITNFLNYYKDYIEGAKYIYDFCKNCEHLVGRANNHQTCLWCYYNGKY